MPDPKESEIYSSIVNPNNVFKKKMDKTLLISMPELRKIRISLEKGKDSYQYVEDFYGDTVTDIFTKLRKLPSFSRTSSKKIMSYANTIHKTLDSKNFFSDSTKIGALHYNFNIRKRLIDFGILTYTDLAVFCAQLTSGQRSYFFTQILKLVGKTQRDFLWNNLLNLLEKTVLSDTSNPITIDWLEIPTVSIDKRKKFLEWGIFTVKDILYTNLDVEELYKYFLYIFVIPRNFYNFLNELYNLININRKNIPLDIGGQNNEVVLSLGKNPWFFPTGLQTLLNEVNYSYSLSNYNYDDYLLDPINGKIDFEYTAGLNSIIRHVAIGSASRILRVITVYRPYQVLDAQNCIKGFLAPSFEILNIILAVIHFAPPELSLGVRIGANIIVRTTSGIDTINEEKKKGVIPEDINVSSIAMPFNENYINQVLLSQGDPKLWHGLFADTVWEMATFIPPTSSALSKYSIPFPSMLAFNVKNIKESYIETAANCFKLNYTPFHQCLGIDFVLTFEKSLNNMDRSYFLNRITYLWDQLAFFNPKNGLRINSFPNIDIYNNAPIQSIFTFDNYSSTTKRKINQLLTFEIIANSILKYKNHISGSYTPLR